MSSRTTLSERSATARAAFFVICLIGFSVACGGDPEPMQAVAFKGDLLQLSISEKWSAEEPSDDRLVFVHPELESVRLSVQDQTEEIGSPMTVAHVKGIVGRQLNRTYGGVVTRVSLSGNAMMRYPYQTEVDGEPVYTENWVLAKPHGYGDIAKVAITLSVPADKAQDPAVVALIERLDKQVGDARLPPS